DEFTSVFGEELDRRGYAAAHHGDGRWNGVAIVSRAGLDDVRRGLLDQPGFPDPEARAMAATSGGIRVWSVYVPNGRTPQDPHFTYKLAWLAPLPRTLPPQAAATPVLSSAFNLPPTP